ncbi:hypothetical protein MUP77_17250, partial [Candidatus Bathyarchaeota archaeon]|nr:hypothetical protein [Candidatus Bathyarchaeota archaeon]
MVFDLIIFPFHDWKKCQALGLMRRDTQIILGLEKIDVVRKILVVDRPVSTLLLFHNMVRKKELFVKGCELIRREGTSMLWQISKKLFVFDTIILEPFTTLFLQRRWWPYIMKNVSFLRQVRSTASNIGITNPILWLFTPISTPSIGYFNEELVVFDALDNWISHEGMAAYHKAACQGYNDVKTNADLVFCGSQCMQRLLAGGKPRTFWVPNGVDTSFFKPDDVILPHDISAIAKPRIGYIGVIDSRVDIELLRQCAMLLPEMNFILIGPIIESRVSIAPLRSLKNVHVIGQKRYDNMAIYINTFDVCLIPHKVNCYTEGMNPL